MNWRILVGLALVLVAIAELYTLMSHPIKQGASPVAAELGCCVWLAAGIFLIVKGAGKKEG